MELKGTFNNCTHIEHMECGVFVAGQLDEATMAVIRQAAAKKTSVSDSDKSAGVTAPADEDASSDEDTFPDRMALSDEEKLANGEKLADEVEHIFMPNCPEQKQQELVELLAQVCHRGASAVINTIKTNIAYINLEGLKNQQLLQFLKHIAPDAHLTLVAVKRARSRIIGF